jgi:hypothetical protein
MTGAQYSILCILFAVSPVVCMLVGCQVLTWYHRDFKKEKDYLPPPDVTYKTFMIFLALCILGAIYYNYSL